MPAQDIRAEIPADAGFTYNDLLGVTALGSDVAAARDQAYRAVDLVDWPEGFCRRDIGWRALTS